MAPYPNANAKSVMTYDHINVFEVAFALLAITCNLFPAELYDTKSGKKQVKGDSSNIFKEMNKLISFHLSQLIICCVRTGQTLRARSCWNLPATL